MTDTEEKKKKSLGDYPRSCVTALPDGDALRFITRGEKGAMTLNPNLPVLIPDRDPFIKGEDESLRDFAKRINEAMGVDADTEKEMLNCSMFGWPPERTKIVVNLMPNVDTPEKEKRLEELLQEKEQADLELLRFVLQNEREIAEALRMYRYEAGDEDLEQFSEDDDGNVITFEKAFEALVREHKAALDRMQYFMCRGEDR